MPDFFRLVKWLERKGKITYNQLVERSVDRNSFGNLCLHLVPHLVHHALRTGIPLRPLIVEYVIMTHAHPNALTACLSLCNLFVNGTDSSLGVVTPENSSTGHADALHTLNTAWWCAQKETEDEVIDEALYLSGDADSVLSLALMLWGWKNGR
jgi:hypothetical protein